MDELSFNSQEKSAPTKCQTLKVSVSTQTLQRRRLRKIDIRWTSEQKAAEINEWTEAWESFKVFTANRMPQSQSSEFFTR